MKKLLLLFSIFVLAFKANTQIFDVDTLWYSGPSDERINIVILAEGYQSFELDKFITDANVIKDGFLNETPFKEYQAYFNIYAIKVISNESGASHPGTATDVTEPAHPVQDVNNYFGTTFDYAGIHRLIVATNSSAVNSVLASNLPQYDLAIVLCNSPYYGGAGGSYATLSTHSSSKEIGLHEMGHSFSKLADEYYAGDNYSAEKPNMTQETDPNLVKWKNWYGDNSIGIYQHSGSGNASSWYRPHQNCKMRYLGYPFCSVCIETTIERIHTLSNILLSYGPSANNNTINTPTFPLQLGVALLKPIPNTLKSEWTLNNVMVYQNLDTVSFDKNDLIEGTNTVQVTIEDTTTLLRVDNHQNIHYTSILWTIEKSTASVIDVKENQFKLEIFPNPTSDVVQVNISAKNSMSYTLKVLNVEGKVFQMNISSLGDSHIIDFKEVPKGMYYIQFEFEDGTILTKEVVRQ